METSFSRHGVTTFNSSVPLPQNIDIDVADIDIWDLCQLCALRMTECMCFANTNNTNYPDLSLGALNPTTPATVLTSINTIPLTWETYQKSYVPAAQPLDGLWNHNFGVPEFEKENTIQLQDTFGFPPRQSKRGAVGMNVEVIEIDEVSSPEGSANSSLNKRAARPEKRVPHRRSPQQPARGRQAQLIQSLRQQVEELKEEHEKLTMALEEKLVKLGVKESPSSSPESSSRDYQSADMPMDGRGGEGVDLEWEMWH